MKVLHSNLLTKIQKTCISIFDRSADDIIVLILLNQSIKSILLLWAVILFDFKGFPNQGFNLQKSQVEISKEGRKSKALCFCPYFILSGLKKSGNLKQFEKF